MESIHAQPLVWHRLLNDCHVVCDVSSPLDTVDSTLSTALPYPELKSNSDRRPVALPSFPSSIPPADLHGPWDTIQDPVSQ